MNVEIIDGWLNEAQRVESPNCDERPEKTAIDLLVIHCIALPPEQYGGGNIQQFFTNQLDPQAHPYFAEIAALKVSAHLLIDRKGGYTQFVPFYSRAWHAGQSNFQGRDACNDFSIGIELEGTDITAFTDAQYHALAAVSLQIMASYPLLTPARIVGHDEIAPGRKTDPGIGFDWPRYRGML